MAYAKARPGKTLMASAGIDSVSHLARVALQAAGGFESLHAPYKCGAQGVASVVSGETDWVLTPAPATLGLVSAGRLRLLGHSMAPASRPLGAVPASGSTLRGFEFARWIGLMAPKGCSHRSAKRCARPCSKPSCARRSRATAQFQRQTRRNGFGPISRATSNTTTWRFASRASNRSRCSLRLARGRMSRWTAYIQTGGSFRLQPVESVGGVDVR